jgi:hypothetical protein
MKRSTTPAGFAVVGSGIFLILLGSGLLLASLVKDARTEQTHCHVHGTELQLDLVPIVYGLPALGEEMQERFPHARTHVLGGCIVQLEKLALVRYCPLCRAALRDWGRGESGKW